MHEDSKRVGRNTKVQHRLHVETRLSARDLQGPLGPSRRNDNREDADGMTAQLQEKMMEMVRLNGMVVTVNNAQESVGGWA